ncbi:MAG TPA: PQQ-binding-like beta-propeller repeat protein [Phycisphaerae bacterium]|nr:PQQ-binding-like beta-propeller repeat protein [Phycisphaerae bacterium]HNU46080.1 PQQ-binding-like beta-propeller repeat protein [Phycisphaerae bacterium]
MRRLPNLLICCGLLFTLVTSIHPSIARGDPWWETYQLTTGSVSDYAPAVSGTTYVWQRNLGTNQAAIMKWAEGDPAPVQISVGTRAFAPRIDQDRVVWENKTGSSTDFEIQLWEAGTITTLTNNTVDDRFADIGGSGIVWMESTYYIVYYDGSSTTHITAVNGGDQYPRVHDDLVVWEYGGSSQNEIYYWHNGTQFPLTSNSYSDVRPETDGQTVVWYAASGPSQSAEIWAWDATAGTRALTSNNVYDIEPDVSGSLVAFARNDGNDLEIFVLCGGVEYQITDNTYTDNEPAIDGDRLVWQGQDSTTRHIFYAILHDFVCVPVGACCVDMDCSVVTEAECTAMDGTFNGPDSFCTFDACEAAAYPAAGWSTYQHDAQRTGRTEAVVPPSPVRLWSTKLADDHYAQSPTLGPDGTIYVYNYKLTAIYPNGGLKWQYDPMASDCASVSVRRDGNIWFGGQIRSGEDGSALCGEYTSVWPGALDSNGNCYIANVRKITPSCELDWEFPGGGLANGPLAVGQDGGVYTTRWELLRKLDPADGSVLWTYPGPGLAGAPAVAADGTVYFCAADNYVVAVHPDGTEKWTLPLPGLRNPNAAPSPAIAVDGTCYVSPKTLAGEPVLVAVSAAGAELWRFVDTIEGGDPVAPVVDGEGTILFSDGLYLIALAPTNGAELWRLEFDTADYLLAPPAIGPDGMLYVVTRDGWARAYGAGCPEPPLNDPPFTYRRVVTEGDLVEGHTVDTLRRLMLDEDGRVVFQAWDGVTDAVFIEKPQGGFDVIGHGTLIAGYEIDMLGMPAWDAQGNRYLAAYVVDVGPAVFVNDTLYASEGPAGVVTFETLDDWDYIDCNDTGHFLTLGTLEIGAQTTLYDVAWSTATLTPLISDGDIIDGFHIDSIQPASVNGYGDDGVPVVRAENGQFAILTPSAVIARTGDTIDGHPVLYVGDPRRDAAGNVYYLGAAEHGAMLFHYLPGGTQTYVVGPYDSLSGHPVVDIVTHAINNEGDVAYLATLLGTDGIFVNRTPVAIADTTYIDDTLVQVVGPDNRNDVSINDSGEVGFIAQLQGEPVALFVALPVASFDDNRDGWISIEDIAGVTACLSGPDVFATSECIRMDGNEDCQCDLRDFAAFQNAFTGPAK